MSLAVLDIRAIADDIAGDPIKLLTEGNPKTEKGESYGWLTGILHLTPHKGSGAFNACPNATTGCINACLNISGMSEHMIQNHRARIQRTKWFKEDRAAFMLALEKEIEALARKAARMGLNLCIRLNGTSDIRWERIIATWRDGSRCSIMHRFRWVQFYDYTKVEQRWDDIAAGKFPANYDLTMSAADGNEDAVAYAVERGARTAVVFYNGDDRKVLPRFWNLPDTYQGRPLVNADRHDLRFLDPPGVVCGLKAKALARFDTTGFVRPITPKGS